MHEPAKKVVNPETGEASYPWMTTDLKPLLANGAVEECDCDDCLAKY
jgi:hypothetical protein